MELIYDILKKLKKFELRQIRNHLAASPFEYEKVGKLFELVTRYKDKDETFFSQKLYGKDPDNTFRVTKSRLKRMLEDVVLNDKSLTGYSAKFINAKLQAEKRLLQGEILLGRGAYKASKNLLHQVISTTRQFSLHNEHYHAEMLLHRNQSINKSVREFQRQTNALLELNETNYLVNEAAILHYSVTNFLTRLSKSDPETREEILRKIERIREVSDQTGSPLARYYYLLSNILFLQYDFQFEQAMEFCKLHLELVEKEPAVHSKQRLGSAYFQLTETTFRSGHLEEAQKYVDQTLAFFSPEETNYLIVLGTAFRIAFWSSNWEKAEDFVNQAIQHPRFEVSAFRAAIWHYYKPCLLFNTERVRPALRELNNATALLTDKEGWNLTFRLQEIMILYEAELYDLLETKILNMRQFVKRTQKKSNLYRPMKLISILMEWHKNSLNLAQTVKSIQRQLRDLQSYHEDIPFDPATGELIRLENWMADKVGA